MRSARFFRFFRYLNLATFREVIVRSGAQRLPGLSAEIAFNAMLAMFPAIVALLTVVGLVGSSQHAFHGFSQQLSRIAPTEVLQLIERFVQEVSAGSSQSLLSISFVAAIWVASAAIGSTMGALDQIHQIPRQWSRPFWKAKLIALGLTFGTILLLVAASVMVFVTDIAVRVVASQSDQLASSITKQPILIEPGVLRVWSRLSLPIALSMVAIAFSFIFRFGPSRWIKGTPILPGAILATVFWAIFSSFFRLYVANFANYNRVYGAVGAVVVLLVWLQVGALTMLIGAQLNVTIGEAMNRQSSWRTTSEKELSYRGQNSQNQTGKD